MVKATGGLFVMFNLFLNVSCTIYVVEKISGCFVDVFSARTSCDVTLCHKLKTLIVPPNQYYFPFFFFVPDYTIVTL